MFPFYSYDIPHTCGPDPKICCQFDFLRMFSSSCPWGVPPRVIDSTNVAERASTLADQYRKKAQLYKTNVLLIPLGDDFRYSSSREWEAQHSNYIKLFEQMNADTTLNIHARFGTLHDYFSILEKRQAESDEKDKLFETLSGDFFTYADRDDHYWSGYFTSRPFYKHMDRSLQHYLRSADISFTLANWKAQSSGKEWPGTKMYDSLIDARRAMSLFQHHDGVTGTAKDHVVVDYGEKMVAALNWSKMIIASAAEYLLKFPQTRDQGLKVDEEHSVDQLPTKSVVEDGGTVVIQNSLGYDRSEVVCIYVSSFKSSIACDESESHIPQQIAPVITVPSGSQKFVMDKDKFELCFVATIPPFGFTKYKVFEAESASSVAKVESSTLMESSDFEAKIFSGSTLELTNEKLTAKFNARNGFLESYKLLDGSETPVEMSFVHYGARGHGHLKSGGDDLSGAYLFLPDGEAKSLSNAENSFVIVDGPIRKSVYIKGPKEILLTQCISIDYNNPSILIKNQVDIRSQGNFEAAMRLKTGIIDGENFYTDLNGYQMIRRKKYEKLPLQAHFYPMPASAFIENDQQRLSLLGRQALGVASLQPGWMEVMLDRRLDQDDGRGVAQNVHDNHRTESVFRLLLEDMETKQNEDATIGYHSLAASIYSNQLHYPPTILFGQLDHAASSEVSSTFKGLEHSLPCDIHPVALRTLSLPTVYGEGGTRTTSPQNSAAFILHRVGIECRTKTKISLTCEPVSDNKVSLKSLFPDPLKNVRQASLTLLYVDEEKEVNDIEITPMELKTVKLNF
uniref:Alpha-mannosidase n=1 Tax=Panagrolaimus superbus TaxID=310955 RepID=A0A914XSF4_9BILA